MEPTGRGHKPAFNTGDRSLVALPSTWFFLVLTQTSFTEFLTSAEPTLQRKTASSIYQQ
ncbi:MAG TPA: hypothetical protein VGN63_04030 [Flavisolibacter sp.]|nr:hypothetical protein [Flavisolibacter sp.]